MKAAAKRPNIVRFKVYSARGQGSFCPWTLRCLVYTYLTSGKSSCFDRMMTSFRFSACSPPISSKWSFCARLCLAYAYLTSGMSFLF